jgi:uncharacterized surface protein with fasciclin (FAS1) repeats
MSSDFKNGMEVRTVQGANLTIILVNSGVMVNNAQLFKQISFVITA